MGNAIDSIFHALAPDDLWEVRIMSSVDGDTVMDSPVLTTKKIRIWGIFTASIGERFRQMGIAEDATAAVGVREPLDMTSQIEYNDVLYEVIQEFKGDRYLQGAIYMYALRRNANIP